MCLEIVAPRTLAAEGLSRLLAPRMPDPDAPVFRAACLISWACAYSYTPRFALRAHGTYIALRHLGDVTRWRPKFDP